MICTTLKAKNNHVPSQIPNLYFDVYPQNSTNSVGVLCTTNAEVVYSYGGIGTTSSTNGARPTYRINVAALIPSVLNPTTNGASPSADFNGLYNITSLGKVSPFFGFQPYGYDFTIFGIVNIVGTFPICPFMHGGGTSFWLPVGASQTILTNGNTVVVSGTVAAGKNIVMIRKSGYDISIRIGNTAYSAFQVNTLFHWQFGVGYYNSLVYTGGLYFGRMIAYRRALSTNEIISITNYLSAVYGTPTYA